MVNIDANKQNLSLWLQQPKMGSKNERSIANEHCGVVNANDWTC